MGIKKRTTFNERFEFFNQDIREQIHNGTLQPGEFLVSEVHLAELYGISKNPVRRILAELEQEGLIEKIPCIGNRVCHQQREPQPTAVLTVMVFEVCYELDVYRRAIALFEELHPGVKVKLDVVPNAIYAQRIIDQLTGTGAESADAILLSDHHYYELASSGHTKLFEALTEPEFPAVNELYRQLLPMYESSGALRAMPLTFSPVVYCCNTGIIPDPEQLRLDDWSDLLAAARRYDIPDSNGLMRQYGLASTNSFRRWLVFLLQNNGSLPTEDGARKLDPNACAEALRFFTELAHNNLLNQDARGGFHADHFLFENNRVAMMMSSYYFMNDLQHLPIRWDVIPYMPGNKSQATLLIGNGIGIPSASPNKTLARSFVRLLASVEVQSLLKQSVISIPACRSVAENEQLWNPAIHPRHYHAFVGFMPQAVPLMQLGVDYNQLSRITKELIYLWSRMDTAETVWSRIQDHVLTPVSG